MRSHSEVLEVRKTTYLWKGVDIIKRITRLGMVAWEAEAGESLELRRWRLQ